MCPRLVGAINVHDVTGGAARDVVVSGEVGGRGEVVSGVVGVCVHDEVETDG